MPSGGDLKSVTCNHPDLGNFFFDPKAGEDSTYMMGGVTSADDAQSVTANGRMIDRMMTERPSVEGVITGSPGDGTIENLKALQNSSVLGVWTFTNINGSVYRLKGKPVGDIAMNAMNSTINLKVAGGGVLQIL
jgi:hypothetical protein